MHALAGLVEEHGPDLILFPASYDARDVAGRLQARTGSTLMANVTDVLGADKARTEILGGTKIVDVELKGPTPRLVIVRPQSFAAEPSGGSAEVVDVKADVPDELKTAERVERHEEAASGPKLESAKVVVAGGRDSAAPMRSSTSTSSPLRSGTRRSAPRGRRSTPAGCRTATRSGRPARP